MDVGNDLRTRVFNPLEAVVRFLFRLPPAVVAALFVGLASVGLSTAPSYAQGARAVITGRVIANASKQPIAGAQINVAGTSLGTVTNDAGRFTLGGLTAGSVVIRVRRIGYTPADFPLTLVAGQAVTVDWSLGEQAHGLTEVLVSVDVAATRRVELGTDIARISVEKEMTKAAVSRVSDLLAGRSAGVDVRQGTGPVGTGSPIRVRGVASINGGSAPVIIVDGIRASNNTASGPPSIDWAEGRTVSRLDDINPNDIVNMQVIKGPTATALYGSEAASGVIIIETKRGQEGKAQLQVTQEFGTYTDDSKYKAIDKYFNLTKYLNITDLNNPIARQFAAVQNPVTKDIFAHSNPFTNALTDPRRTGGTASTGISLRGGTLSARYFVSGHFENTKGVFVNNYMNRANLRANLDVMPHPTLQLSFSSTYSTSDIRLPESSRSFRGYSTNAGAGAPVNTYGIRPDGTRGDCLATLEKNALASATCDRYQGNLSANFHDLNTVFGGQKNNRFIGSVTGTWSPANWISNRLTAGLDNSQNNDVNEFPLDPARPFGLLSTGFIRDNRQTTLQQSVDFTSTITRQLTSLLGSTSTIGAQYFSLNDQNSGCTGQGYASPTANACNATLIQTGFLGGSENVQIGAFVQQRLAYREYAFVTAGLRVDDNSAFGAKTGVIWSPSLNASLLLSDLPFWKWETFNSVRLRAAYGKAAQAPPTYAADQRLEPVRLTVGSSTVAAVSALYPGNPNLGPEKKSELELGIDVAMWNNRLDVKLTHFRQKVEDALLGRLLAPSLGYRATQFINIAELTNNGSELSVSADLISKPNISWNVEFTASTQNPIVSSMGNTPDLFLGNDRGMIKKGYAPGQYYGPIVESATRGADGQIVRSSIVYKKCPELPQNYCDQGSPQPKDLESLSTTLTLFSGKLQLHTVLDRRGNVTKQNGTMSFIVGFHRDRGGPLEYVFRESMVSPQAQAAMEERLRGVANADSWVWHEDGAFVKWREFTATYIVPSSWSTVLRARDASFTVGARNLATWTKFRGIDPESFVRGGLTTIGGNEEFFGEAVPRHVFGRFNISF